MPKNSLIGKPHRPFGRDPKVIESRTRSKGKSPLCESCTQCVTAIQDAGIAHVLCRGRNRASQWEPFPLERGECYAYVERVAPAESVAA